MPKARSNPARLRARANRHDPIARARVSNGAQHATLGNGNSKSNGSRTGAATTTTTAKEIVIPLLSKLPLSYAHAHAHAHAHGAPSTTTSSTAAPPSTPSSGDTLWALSSLSALLSNKSERKVLLSAKHKLVQRLISALQHDDADVRTEASGTMRNLCVQAGFEARRSLAEQGALIVIVEQLQSSAAMLSMRLDHASAHRYTEERRDGVAMAPSHIKVVDKPMDQMNKKEKRHAAKAAKAAAAQDAAAASAGVAAAAAAAAAAAKAQTGDVPMDADADNHVTAAAATAAAPANEDDEKTALALTRQINLCVSLWCILEAGSEHLAPLAPHLTALTCVLCSIVERASLAGMRQIDQHASSEPLSALARIAAQKSALEVEAGNAAANALIGLTEAHPPAAAALTGVARLELERALRAGKAGGVGKRASKKTKSRLDPASVGPDPSAQDAQSNVDALDCAVRLLRSALDRARTEASGGKDEQTTNMVHLGLLSVGVLRNINAALPAELANHVRISSTHLQAYELQHALPCLTDVLSLYGAEWQWTEHLGAVQREESNTSSGATQKPADVEMEGSESADAGHIADAATANGSELLADEEGQTTTKAGQAAEDRLGILQLSLEIIAELLGSVSSSGLSDAVQDRAADADADAAMVDDEDAQSDELEIFDALDEDEEEVAAEARITSSWDGKSFSSHPAARIIDSSLSVNLVGMATQCYFAASQCLPEASARMEGLLGLSSRALSVVSNLFDGVAPFAPLPPSSPEAPEHMSRWRQVFAQWRTTSKPLLQTWCDSFDLLQAVLSGSAKDQLDITSACLLVLYTLAKLHEGADLPLAWQDHQPNAVLVCLSSIASSPTSQSVADNDASRAKSLGILSIIARSPSLEMSLRGEIAQGALQILESVLSPDRPIGPNTLVAATNAIIDTFADETSPYDEPVFRQQASLPRLRKVVGPVKSLAKTIDKRTDGALRALADESTTNLRAFVEYRNGLGY
ncbi:hypothetical protein IE81DRAFT_326334 [Ceraceosorus guamensis]|uniref:SYO1-like TPR repeats domain-containing protein n=1 Tax=Ceraceosorus guamensis TaxID=1522189 RepID=A0A316VQP1_9BASI|nr:hypothetical protein IE81DRAFT_326334 [Ceraceosorus guamensis]PWN39650.1 hypothetical protein IE81DRAFT_326334 [Ceraceosorus guamensis]